MSSSKYGPKYTKALAARICERIASGRALNDVCRDPDVPVSSAAVCRWVLNRPGFADIYGRACAMRSEVRFEELVELADEMARIELDDAGERKLVYAERQAIFAMRNKVDVMKWALSKMRPEKYSDKLQLEQSGDQTVKVEVVYVDDDPAGP